MLAPQRVLYLFDHVLWFRSEGCEYRSQIGHQAALRRHHCLPGSGVSGLTRGCPHRAGPLSRYRARSVSGGAFPRAVYIENSGMGMSSPPQEATPAVWIIGEAAAHAESVR